MYDTCRLATAFVAIMLLMPTHVACSRRSPETLDASLARASLHDFLTTWQAGQDIATLQTRNPPIIANDDDQAAGQRLKSFKVLDDGISDGRNLHVKTSLTTKSLRGQQRTIVTTYIVGTHPMITIFRE